MSDTAELTVHERLDAVRKAADSARGRTADAARAILDTRARALARRTVVADDSSADAIELLLVQVGEEQLGIPLENIVAIARSGSIAPLPRAVRPVYGVTAWRGRPLTVLSLGDGKVEMSADSRLVVLGSGTRAALAVLVDAVHDVRRTLRGELTPTGAGPRHRYTLGVTSDGLMVVSGDALLTPETLPT